MCEDRKILKDSDITIDLIEKKLNKLIDEIHKRNKSNFMDINQIVELYVVKIFNILYGWELRLCDNSYEKCIDASDDKNKVFIQITSNNSIDKIKKTKEIYSTLENVIGYRFIYFILGEIKNYRINSLDTDIKKFLIESVVDKNWLIVELKRIEEDKEKLAKVYDNLLKVFYDIGISRDIVIQELDKNKNNLYLREENIFWEDEIFKMSFVIYSHNKIFKDYSVVFRYNDIIIYIKEEQLVSNYFVTEENFIENNVHFNNYDENMAYLDIITTSLYMDTHIIFKIFNMFKKLQIQYENDLRKKLEVIGVSDRRCLLKKRKKVIMGRILKSQWDDILKYARGHSYDLSDNSENIFSKVYENTFQIGLLGNVNKEYKGVMLATISIDSDAVNYKDDVYVNIMWGTGDSNINYTVFDNINHWKVDFTRKYIEDKILKTKMLEPVFGVENTIYWNQ